MPIPKRIQFLLESVLSETPDRPLSLVGSVDANASKLKELNLDVNELKNFRWTDTDAVTFAVDVRYHVVMWLANNDGDRAYQHSDFDDFFTGGYRDAKNVSKGVVGMPWEKYKVIGQWHNGHFNSGKRADDRMLMGRLWRNSGFVSFWNTKSDAVKEWKVLEDFLANIKLDPQKCVYEFIDKLEVETFDEVTNKETKSVIVDPKVLSKIHTSPELKRAVLGTDGGKKRSADDQYSRMGDGVIKLGSLLKEDPDGVHAKPDQAAIERMVKLGIDVHRIVKNQLWYDVDDAVPFAFDIPNNVMIFSNRESGAMDVLTHEAMYNMMRKFADHPHLFKSGQLPYGWTITPTNNEDWIDAGLNDLLIGPVTVVGLNSDKSVVKYATNWYGEETSGPSRGNPKFVLGRVWPDASVVSFWSKMAQVLQPTALRAVEELLKSLQIDPTKSVYEFMDHQDKLFFHDELKVPANSTMSNAEYKEKLAKQHLDAKAKRDLNKDVEKPDKFGGVLPVKYHAMSHTSDGIIKLGDLLK